MMMFVLFTNLQHREDVDLAVVKIKKRDNQINRAKRQRTQSTLHLIVPERIV